ncbi:hypothetical protein RJD24_18530 [Bacillaceae bacterium IKA-2]|nr:hypothetical protein RJD24_18530 [Bacillaceae bacterium IKA-2]
MRLKNATIPDIAEELAGRSSVSVFYFFEGERYSITSEPIGGEPDPINGYGLNVEGNGPVLIIKIEEETQ